MDLATLETLPYIDEHAVVVAATPEAVWDAVLRTLERLFSRAGARRFAGVLGVDPPVVSGWDRPGVGTTIPGFRVVTADRPTLVVVAGSHRFSRYGIIFRIDPTTEGTRCSAESRAEFPGLPGRLYRLAVIGTRGHVVAVGQLLNAVRRAAETG